MRVLLIEDDPIHATLLSIWLRSLYGVGLTIETAPTFTMAKDRIGERWELIVADLRLPNGNAGPLLAGRTAVLTSSVDPEEGRRLSAKIGVPFAEKGDREAFQAACLEVCPIVAQSPPSSAKQAWAMLSSRARTVSVALSIAVPLLTAGGGMMFARGASAEVEKRHDRDIEDLKRNATSALDGVRTELKELGRRMRAYEVQQATLHGSINGLLIRLGVSADVLVPPASVPPGGAP